MVRKGSNSNIFFYHAFVEKHEIQCVLLVLELEYDCSALSKYNPIMGIVEGSIGYRIDYMVWAP